MKINIVNRTDVPSTRKKGKYDQIIEAAMKVTGTKTVKLTFDTEQEAKNARSTIPDRAKTAYKTTLEVCLRGKDVWVYPIEPEPDVK